MKESTAQGTIRHKRKLLFFMKAQHRFIDCHHGIVLCRFHELYAHVIFALVGHKPMKSMLLGIVPGLFDSRCTPV